ncbi:MAG TPA: cob(I)yrinic acid a,c-diamide adenosyltransferase [Pirellulales bacterium]|nr:cob(I)yrinic acid a,c-diamide adenosyltransferase [Pirellulales bacterium]
MKIYTKTGDSGETGLFGGPRVSKDDPRVEAYGDVDELNALLGLVRCEPLEAPIDQLLAVIQNELFDLGAELASPEPDRVGTRRITAVRAGALESAIDQYEAQLPPLKNFILPGGVRAAALLHLARTVCRRAERRVVALSRREPISAEIVVYVNRLSDLLFVLARAANHVARRGDVPWQQASTTE